MGRKNPNNRSKGRGHFLMLPDSLTAHEAYFTLSDSAKSMLVEIARQYTGKNNGDLSATIKLLKSRGWNSNSKIARSVSRLIDHGLVVLTRQGGRHKCNLYGVTWHPIDRCGDKLDIKSTQVASNEWRQFRFSLHPQKVQCTPSEGSIGGGRVVELNPQKVQSGYF